MPSSQGTDNLRVQRRKLHDGLERIIGSLVEGLIDKDRFTARLTRAKSRITELDPKISASTGDADHQERLR